MTRLFSTHFMLDTDITLENLLDLEKEWIIKSPHSKLKKEDLIKLVNHGDKTEKNGFSYEIGRYKDEKGEILGINYINPGSRGYDTWITKAVAYKQKGEFPISITIDHETPRVQQKAPSCNKPYLIRLILDNLGGGRDGDLQVRNTPYFIKDGQGEEAFVADILKGSAKSIMPVVYISRDYNGLTNVNPNKLSIILYGMAHVLVEPSRKFSFLLKDETNGKNVFDGAVGIYWADGYNRFYWLPKEITQEKDPSATVFYKIVELLKSRRVQKELDWQNLQSRVNMERIELLRSEKEKMKQEHEEDKDSLLDTYADELDIQTRQLEEADSKIKDLEKELRKVTFSKPISTEINPSAQVNPMYKEEVKIIVSEGLKSALKNSYSGSRRENILEQVVKSMDSSTNERDKIADKIKVLFKGYIKMTGPIRSELERMGFEMTQEGKHWKLFRPDNPNIFEMLSKTSSDRRAGMNTAAEIIRRFL
jgi:hypothetical protein